MMQKIRLILTVGGMTLASSDIAQSLVGPALPVIPAGSYNITNYGAVADGVATNTAAIQAALDAAKDAGGGTVEIPPGVFLSGPIHFANQIDLHLDAGAILRMLPLPWRHQLAGKFHHRLEPA